MNLQTMRWIKGPNLVIVFSTLVLVGAAAYSTLHTPKNPALDSLVGTSVYLEGAVVKDPDVRAKATLLTVEVKTINNIHATGRVLVSAGPFTAVSYGDRITASGKLEIPQAFETDSGRTFNYQKYLLAEGVTHVLSFGSVKKIGEGEGNTLVAALLSLKHVLERGINAALPEPESSLAGGLLLGDKQSLGDSITSAFRRAGVVHIIVLSGYNVSVVVGAVLFIALYWLPKRFALLIAALATVAFAVMTGASETTVRACAMALIVLLAKGLNRPADGLRILLIVAAGMALYDPYLVLYDLSYQLSVLSTLGLILFSNSLKSKILFVPEAWGLRDIVSATVATQLTVLPLLIVSVGQVSAVSLFTNILVLPAVSFAMLTSFIAALLALLSFALALPVTALSYALLHYIIAVSVWFGNLPFAAIQIPPSAMWLTLSILACFYSGAFLLYAIYTKRKTLR